jgi:hypothetical protein
MADDSSFDPGFASANDPVPTGNPTGNSPSDGASDSSPDDVASGYKLSEEQRKWLLDNFYAEFLTFKCPRGTRNRPNGKTYAHGLFDKFEDKYLGEWSQVKRDRYKSKIQDVHISSRSQQL